MKQRLIALLFLLSSFAALSGCTEDDKVQPGIIALPGKDNPSQVSYNTQVRFSTDGQLRALLHAGRIRTYDQQRYTLLDSAVRIDFFDREGKHSSVLTSLGAKVNDVNKNMTAYEHVHIVSDSGTVVDTDTLEWDNQKQTLHSDDPVRIVEKNGRVTNGIGFESDQSLTHYQILHPIIVAPRDAMTSGSTPTNAQPQRAPVPTFGSQPQQSPFGQTNSPSPPPAARADSMPTSTKKATEDTLRH